MRFLAPSPVILHVSYASSYDFYQCVRALDSIDTNSKANRLLLIFTFATKAMQILAVAFAARARPFGATSGQRCWNDVLSVGESAAASDLQTALSDLSRRTTHHPNAQTDKRPCASTRYVVGRGRSQARVLDKNQQTSLPAPLVGKPVSEYSEHRLTLA